MNDSLQPSVPADQYAQLLALTEPLHGVKDLLSDARIKSIKYETVASAKASDVAKVFDDISALQRRFTAQIGSLLKPELLWVLSALNADFRAGVDEEILDLVCDARELVWMALNIVEAIELWVPGRDVQPAVIGVDEFLREAQPGLQILMNAERQTRGKPKCLVDDKIPVVTARGHRGTLATLLMQIALNVAEAGRASRLDIKANEVDGRARISIADNGGGMPSEVCEGLFAHAPQRLSRFGGEIEVVGNSRCNGAGFIISLPIAEAA